MVTYSVCWVVGEYFECIVIFKVRFYFGEVVSCVHDVNSSTIITWFDYNGSVIFEIVLSFPLMLGYCRFSGVRY